jgi:hypothetical protein
MIEAITTPIIIIFNLLLNLDTIESSESLEKLILKYYSKK